MEIASVIQFEGSVDELVWKSPVENFNSTSQLIVDETHEALLVVNGMAADLFTAGNRTLETANIPIARSIIEMPTNGRTPFPCKVFFVNMVHQMDMRWGTQGPITLNDPQYDIFLHVMANGSMSFTVKDTRKFLLKLVGFRTKWNPDDLVAKFRGIISAYVKDYISKLMIDGKQSYFEISSSVFDLSKNIKTALSAEFDEYGVDLVVFNIDAIEVPDADYQKIKESKERRSGRAIEGYTWQEEQQMKIANSFASNEGSMGAVGGAVGGFVAGGLMGGAMNNIVGSAMDPSRVPTQVPPATSPAAQTGNRVDVNAFFAPKPQTAATIKCAGCGQELNANAKFCFNCGEKVLPPDDGTVTCPNCGTKCPKGKFCSECGYKFASACPKCGTTVSSGQKFCPECGEKL